MVEKKLKITGLDCMDCAKGLEASIAALPNVESASLDFFTATLSVRGEIPESDLHTMINKLGYGVEEESAQETSPANEPKVLVGFWRYLLGQLETRLALIAAVILALSLILNGLDFPRWLVISLQMGALALGGWPIAKSGVVNLWVNHTFNINFLMTVAGIGAVVIGEYLEAASMILLFDIAEALEGFTNARARNVLAGLTDLAPTHAIKKEGDHDLLVPVETLEAGDCILVRPGERIPLDGRVVEGMSDINQAPITGESMPVWKGEGDEVFSGSVNGNGSLIIEVTRLVGDSTLQRIIQMVTEAQSRQSKSQKFIDRFAKYYTPAMVLIAVLIAVIPTLVFGEPLLNAPDGTRGWLYRALALLVIGCPCALVISTPVTMVASLTRAAKAGVLFKGGVFMEALSRVNAFAFDKTGTLTYGEPKVVDVRDLGCEDDGRCDSCDDLIALAYALERGSTHPLAQAIADEAEWRGVTERYPSAKNLKTRGGLGIEGQVNGHLMTIGNLRLFEEEHDIPPSVYRWVAQAESEGRTAMLLCDGEHVRGFIAVADRIRDESVDVVRELNTMGKHTVMLTGDNQTVARSVGERVGLEGIRANLLPEDKQSAVEKLNEEFTSVAMVGDGINDAPALASADIGIAMGGSGSAQAMETADVVLMGDDIQKLPFAVKLSQFANQLIRQNIVFSIGSKVLVAILAILGYAPLWLAVLADMGVSLLVTLNGLRAMRFKGL
jgi:Cd2+/Zn2+-exporting ATPase